MTTDKDLAEEFHITGGQLFSNLGQFSTDIDIPNLPFEPSTTLGPITTTFTESASLVWENGNFSDGVASYCILDGVVQFVFLDDAPACESVQLSVIPGKSPRARRTSRGVCRLTFSSYAIGFIYINNTFINSNYGIFIVDSGPDLVRITN